MAYAMDLKSIGAIHKGSSPFSAICMLKRRKYHETVKENTFVEGKGLKYISAIRRKLNSYTTEKLPTFWLQTNSKRLNSVLGNPELGIPYGKMYEISGDNSQGKTALLLELAKLAQDDGALVIWEDLENSFDEDWARRRGLDTENMVLIQPYIKRKKKDDMGELSTAEDLGAQTEVAIREGSKHYEKIFLGIDSVTAMLVDAEADAGVENQNMNTITALSRFLSRLTRRWMAVASTRNVMMVFINQIRMTPGKMFGDPETTTGGKALPFFCAARVKMRRVAGGRMKKGMDVIGIKGVIRNVKNKTGKGSIEGAEVGFKLFWDKPFKFLDVKKVKVKGDD